MIDWGRSFLSYYRNFFGDRTQQFVDLEPEYDKGLHPREHVSLLDKFLLKEPTEEELAGMEEAYTHPCWCNPELIYVDDAKGNEVWLHKPVQ